VVDSDPPVALRVLPACDRSAQRRIWISLNRLTALPGWMPYALRRDRVTLAAASSRQPGLTRASSSAVLGSIGQAVGVSGLSDLTSYCTPGTATIHPGFRISSGRVHTVTGGRSPAKHVSSPMGGP
jgi:hypothetical protein